MISSAPSCCFYLVIKTRAEVVSVFVVILHQPASRLFLWLIPSLARQSVITQQLWFWWFSYHRTQSPALAMHVGVAVPDAGADVNAGLGFCVDK